MTKTARKLAFAGLIAGASFMAQPASANSIHDEGYFGGSYTSIAPSSSYGEWRHARRVGPLHGPRFYGPRYAYAPYAYTYGPAYYGPGYYGPGFSIGVGVY